jgi:hypothetical protein
LIEFIYSSELKARSKRWDEKHLDSLRLRKDKLFDEYKEQQKKKRREAELINARFVIIKKTQLLKQIKHKILF